MYNVPRNPPAPTMNVFILCTGRCGSKTFIEASRHLTNYSAAHESRTGLIGPERLNYPANHIEADNRLSWLLGRLEKTYGDTPFYVHLVRDGLETAKSFSKRFNHAGIVKAYRDAILQGCAEDDALGISVDYVATVNSNIELFLKDKSKKMVFRLDRAETDFPIFWERIAGQGDLRAALLEWKTVNNASAPVSSGRPARGIAAKARRILRDLPAFLRNA